MKSVATNYIPVPPRIEFPCLLISKITGIIVLALDWSEPAKNFIGVIIHCPEDHIRHNPLGYHCADWLFDQFNRYTGKVLLSND
jgi:hypothetical protein